MPTLKVATFNVEWMYSIFGAQWKTWDGTIPGSFEGKWIGPIKLEAIQDAPELCERIAGVIKGTGAKIIGIQEGAPRKDQMKLFVQRFLGNDFVVYSSNPTSQTIHALVHRSISDNVTAIAYDSPEMKKAWTKIPYQPWSTIAKQDRKQHKFHRRPLVLQFEATANKCLKIIIVHTKSKVSELKTKSQWENREADAVLSALSSRQKLSAEVYRLREYIEQQLAPPNQSEALVVMGDFNDGPLAEEMEREFLLHNIIDELVGSIITPSRVLKYAMTPSTLEVSTTTEFPNPFKDNEITRELIDHILLSPGVWRGGSGFALVEDSCQVEEAVFQAFFDDTGEERVRQLRPSDHKPVSTQLFYLQQP